jgi:radical SAM family uncharacterized protein
MAILYDLINQRRDALVERAYIPWIDMENAMRSNGIPLFSLETKHTLVEFDIVGFSLPYESLFTNALNALDLGVIPLFSFERTQNHPLVIAGGHATFNPEPMHAFIDAFVIGEGEEVIGEIINTYQAWKNSGSSRQALLNSLSQIWGIYVPALYEAKYSPDGTFNSLDKLSNDAPLPILKRIVPKLPPPPTHFIVPYIETVHNRIPIEIMRGCTRGCRFCHAGMVTRPVRERPIDEVISAIEKSLANTGFEEIGLLSLSSSDYTHIQALIQALNQRFEGRKLHISLPSLRIDTFSIELMDTLKEARRGGFTLAPEAATDHMREIINKPITTQKLLDTAREIYQHGWRTIKLYFMIGHPSETLEDVEGIVKLCRAVLTEGWKVMGKRAKLSAGISTFVPKPHTPFQWVPCDAIENIQAKQDLLKRELRDRDIKMTWTKPEETLLEAWLSRGDRRMSAVIYQAWKNGAKLDAWQDQTNFDAWKKAFDTVGLDPAFYTHRQRALDEAFPWDHIDIGVRKKFLLEDYEWSLEGKTRADCRQYCFACGILPTYNELRVQNPGNLWQCPEVKLKSIRKPNLIKSLIAPITK